MGYIPKKSRRTIAFSSRFLCNILASLAVTAIIFPAAGQENYSTYWGDIHAHTSWSADAQIFQRLKYGLQTQPRPPIDAWYFARDSVHLDFMCITDHAERGFTGDWDSTEMYNNRFYSPGSFVTFHGYEYTDNGVTATRNPGAGHKCVLFRGENYPVEPVGADVASLDSLWDILGPYDCMTIPHHTAKGANVAAAGGGGGNDAQTMTTDWNMTNADLMPLVEVFSIHGSSFIGDTQAVDDFRNIGSVDTVLERWVATGDPGYKLGFIGGTDNHMCRPGGVEEIWENSYALEGPSTGGLAAVLATEKTREAIYDALSNRRCYATTGARIGLDFHAEHGSGTFLMGETVLVPSNAGVISLHATAVGANAPIDRIELVSNGSVIAVSQSTTLTFTDTVTTARAYYFVRVYEEPTMQWDSAYLPEMAWSSPIFVESSSSTGVLRGGKKTNAYSSPRIVYVNRGDGRIVLKWSQDITPVRRIRFFDVSGRRIVAVADFREGIANIILDPCVSLVVAVAELKDGGSINITIPIK